MPSLIDILPPEAQTLLGGIALILAVAGLILACTGIKIARFTIAFLLGLAGAAIGAWMIPTAIDLSPITAVLIGFVAGALSGALAFRLLQGVTLALCLGLAAGIFYYNLRIQPSLPPASPATQSAPDDSTSIDQELIPLDALPPGTLPSKSRGKSHLVAESQKPSLVHLAAATVQSLAKRWSAIPQTHQKRLLIVSISVASIALLIAFGFPRLTTWLITSLLGTFMLLVSMRTLIHLYSPEYESYFPIHPRASAPTFAIVTLIALWIQYSNFWPRRKWPVTTPPPVPVPATPVPAHPA